MELVLGKAWEARDTDFDGAYIQILLDLSRATLQRRAMLKPLLDIAQRAGITYSWGFPIAVTFKKQSQFFTLRSPSDLPALFTFFGTDSIDVPDWLQALLSFSTRPYTFLFVLYP